MILGQDTAAMVVQGLEDPATVDGIKTVKQAVTNALKAADSSVGIRWTDYFNNTLVPDMVMEWPGHRQHRHVHLRLTTDPLEIAEDLGKVGGDHPLMFGLGGVDLQDGGALSPVLVDAAASTESLFLDPWSIEPFTNTGFQTQTVLGSAVLRGGRSALLPSTSESIVVAVERGFEGALLVDADETAPAVVVLEEHLRSGPASTLIGFLQALWLGKGGSLADFPGGNADKFGSLGESSLRFLLSWATHIEDADFWRSVGRGVTVGKLAELGEVNPTPNLQSFVRSHLSLLYARAMAVRPANTALDTPDGVSWRVRGSKLVMSGTGFDATFGEKVEDLATVPEVVQDGLDVESFQRRSEGIGIAGIVMRLGAEELTWRSDEGADIKASPRLGAILEQVSPDAQITEVSVNASRTLDCDLVGSGASTGNRGTVSLMDHLVSALPVLWEMTDNDRAAVGSLVEAAAEVDSKHGQLPLFTDPEP